MKFGLFYAKITFSALCNGTCLILRVFSYTLCPSYLSLLTFILALASRVLFVLIQPHLATPFPNCPSALRSRPLVFSFSFIGNIYKGRSQALALGACTFCSLPMEHISPLHFEH